MAVLHAEIERLIAATGLASTTIRPGMFASNARFWWSGMLQDGDVVRWPYGAAETAPIDERDIAAVAARALYEDGHAGEDYVLTGPESLSQAEQVSIIGAAIGRQIRFEELSPEEFRRETGELKDLSFDSISAAGPHGAVVHYRPTTASNLKLKARSLYLTDSGGQYADGTTDITRTVAVGPQAAETKDRFTRVLKGHIALALAR